MNCVQGKGPGPIHNFPAPDMEAGGAHLQATVMRAALPESRRNGGGMQEMERRMRKEEPQREQGQKKRTASRGRVDEQE